MTEATIVCQNWQVDYWCVNCMTRSQVFHQSGCRHFNCKNCVDVFKSRKQAVDAGFRPCGMCRP